jgi:hypothetical protein
MGLLSGSVSVSRFNVTKLPKTVDFDRAAFREIEPGSEIRVRQGFVPPDVGVPYEAGTKRWAFRARMDRLRADPTLLRERFRQLVHAEIAAGAQFLSAKRRREIREQADEELTAQTLPSSRIIEGCLDGRVLYVASTAMAYLGVVTELLRKIGVHVEPKAPWIDRGDLESPASVVSDLQPGQSVLGSRLLKELLGDSEVSIAEDNGYARLQTPDTKVTLSGSVLHELMHYVELDSEILVANMTAGEVTFRFDALSFRLSILKIETSKHEHWTERLDERLEKIAAVFDLLDRKFIELGVDDVSF